MPERFSKSVADPNDDSYIQNVAQKPPTERVKSGKLLRFAGTSDSSSKRSAENQKTMDQYGSAFPYIAICSSDRTHFLLSSRVTGFTSCISGQRLHVLILSLIRSLTGHWREGYGDLFETEWSLH